MTVRYKESKSLYPLRGHPQYIDIYHLPLFNNEYKEVSPSSELFKRWTESTARWLVGRNFPLGKVYGATSKNGKQKSAESTPSTVKGKTNETIPTFHGPMGK